MKINRWWIAFGIIVLLLPIILNWLITRPTFFNFVGSGVDWLNFWVTYFSAIASFAMVALTWWTLKQSKSQNDALLEQNEKILQNNKEQLEELKRQWNAERNPNILLSIGVAKQSFFLKISNVGLSAAYDIRLSVNEEFLNMIPSKEAKNCFTPLVNPFFIDGKSTKYIYIGQGKEIVNTFKDKHIIMKVSGTYCNGGTIDFSCNMDEIVSQKFARIVDDMTEAIEGIESSISSANSADHHYNTIQQSLDAIAKSLGKYQTTIILSEKEKDNHQTELSMRQE